MHSVPQQCSTRQSLHRAARRSPRADMIRPHWVDGESSSASLDENSSIIRISVVSKASNHFYSRHGTSCLPQHSAGFYRALGLEPRGLMLHSTIQPAVTGFVFHKVEPHFISTPHTYFNVIECNLLIENCILPIEWTFVD